MGPKFVNYLHPINTAQSLQPTNSTIALALPADGELLAEDSVGRARSSQGAETAIYQIEALLCKGGWAAVPLSRAPHPALAIGLPSRAPRRRCAAHRVLRAFNVEGQAACAASSRHPRSFNRLRFTAYGCRGPIVSVMEYFEGNTRDADLKSGADFLSLPAQPWLCVRVLLF